MSEPEEEKNKLEERRSSLEEQRSDGEGTAKRLGVFLTAAISLAAVLVSAAQVWIARLDKANQIELAKLEQERSWKLDLAKFLFEHEDSVFSEDPVERERVRNLLLVSFPNEITEALFGQLEATAPDEEKDVWRQGQVLAQLSGRILYVHFKVEENRALVQRLADELGKTLGKKGLQVEGIERRDEATNGDVRYFHGDDGPAAQQVKRKVEDFLKEKVPEIDLEVHQLERLASKVRPGTLELWLPAL